MVGDSITVKEEGTGCEVGQDEKEDTDWLGLLLKEPLSVLRGRRSKSSDTGFGLHSLGSQRAL